MAASEFDETFDVVVAGSGAGGMAAALVARHAGLAVLVLEKTDRFGGSTAVSGGAMWVPGNHHAAEVGPADSREAVMTYLRAVIGNRLHTDLVEAYLDNGPEMVAFMERETALQFNARAHSPDYQADLAGASMGGRTLDPAPFDGRELGDKVDLLRPPYDSFLAFGGMMVNRTDIDRLLGVARSFGNFAHATSLLVRYAKDRLRYRRGTRLLMGNALAGRLLKSALDRKIDLRNHATVEEILIEDGAVTGVRANIDGRQRLIAARRGVVLATGGFPHDAALARQTIPHAENHFTMSPVGNAGDGVHLALAAGGTLAEDNAGPAFWAPVSVMKLGDGREIRFPHLILDRQKPGLVAVNATGRRFVNESASYHDFVEGMHRSHETVSTIPAFLICDRRFLRKYGLGLVRPGPRFLRPFIKAGYLVEARSIRELAGKLDLPSDALSETIARMNEYARTGEDPEFKKGGNAYNRYLGDPAHKPNPCLGPIDTPPFYAVRVYPGDIGTATGLRTDAHARVLDHDGHPVPGLFAVGNDMNSVMAGTYPAAGITLGPALTFGYIAGRTLSGVKLPLAQTKKKAIRR
jgi:succinate dehydrogenase/fumarate reductase flavoprotein subunit